MFYIAISELDARYDTKMKNPATHNYHNRKIDKEINYSSKSGHEKYSKRHDSG